MMDIDISAPSDLSDGGVETVTVDVKNRGVNNLSDVFIDVEMPAELIVLDEQHDRGINLTEGQSSTGGRVFHYEAGNIEVATDSTLKYKVQTSFGTLERSGDIRVTAWQKDLKGQKLVKTRFIKLRHA